MASIELKSVDKRFGETQIINQVSLKVHDGEFLVIVGPSGSGKSTLLRIIAGLEEVSAGQVLINQEDMTETPPEIRGCSMVFQSYALYPHMTVAKNIAFALGQSNLSTQEKQARVRQAAKTVKLDHLLDRLPKALSGGQRQRVAIARALVKEPSVFLFDEPLSNLDAQLRIETRFELMKLHHQLKATMIHVTHDQTEALTLADRIVLLNEGQCEQIDTPEAMYFQPRNQFVAGFLGSPQMNFIQVKVAEVTATDIVVDSYGTSHCLNNRFHSQALKPGSMLTLGFRPEKILLKPSKHQDLSLVTRVIRREFTGRESNLLVDFHGQNLVVGCSTLNQIQANTPLDVRIKQEDLYCFDAQGHCLNDYQRFPMLPTRHDHG